MKLREAFERYLVSDCGRIFIKETGKEIVGAVTKKGYRYTTITCSYLRRGFSFHQIVARTWVDNPHNFDEVDHKDGNKLNNSAANLEWVSRGENIRRAYKLNSRSAVGVNNANAVLTIEQVETVCEGITSGLTNIQIEEGTGVKRYLVSRIRCKKAWRSISDGYF